MSQSKVYVMRVETASGSIYQFRDFVPADGSEHVCHVQRLPGRGAASFFEEAAKVVRYTQPRLGERMSVAWIDWDGETRCAVSTEVVSIQSWQA